MFITGKLAEHFDLDEKYAAKAFLEGQKNPELRDKIRFALAGNEIELSTQVKQKDVNFKITPIPNKKGSYNLLCIGYVVKEGCND